MTTTLDIDLPARVCECVEVPRIVDGRPAIELIVVTYEPRYRCLPTTLIIDSGWSERKRDYRVRTRYRVDEDTPQVAGRAFLLWRDPADIARDPWRTERYGVLIAPNDADSLCECPGFASAQTRQQTCKHVAALTYLCRNGYLGERP